jgi:protein-disulfide isomerase
MQQKYGSRGFTVLGVAMDEEGKSVVEPYLQKERFKTDDKPDQAINYPIVLGDDAIADRFGGLIGYPTSILISPEGREMKHITGLISYDEMARAIESQLH